MNTNESIVPQADTAPSYTIVADQETGVRTASVHIDGITYSVMVPAVLDREVILADQRRRSRAPLMETLMDGSLEEAALVNRTVQLVAFDAYEAGELPKDAWASFRVATTVAHDKLLKDNSRLSSLGNFALNQPD